MPILLSESKEISRATNTAPPVFVPRGDQLRVAFSQLPYLCETADGRLIVCSRSPLGGVARRVADEWVAELQSLGWNVQVDEATGVLKATAELNTTEYSEREIPSTARRSKPDLAPETVADSILRAFDVRLDVPVGLRPSEVSRENIYRAAWYSRRDLVRSYPFLGKDPDEGVRRIRFRSTLRNSRWPVPDSTWSVPSYFQTLAKSFRHWKTVHFVPVTGDDSWLIVAGTFEA